MDKWSPGEYRKKVGRKLDRITSIMAKISVGDFSDRIDFSTVEDDEFAELFRGLDLMMDDLAQAQAERDRQSRYHKMRAEAWRQSVADINNEETFVESLCALAGPLLDIDRISYYKAFPEQKIVRCIAEWRAAGLPAAKGEDFPCEPFEPLTQKICIELHLANIQIVDEPFRSMVKEQMEKMGIHSLLAVAHGKTTRPEGYFSFAGAKARTWLSHDTELLLEFARIVSTRKARFMARQRLKNANELLEKKIRKRTRKFHQVNIQFRKDIAKRINAEKALRENETLCQRVVETSPGAVTEKRRHEEELFRARKLESAGLLVGGIAHDFNNILAGVCANIGMARAHMSGNSDAEKLLREAEKAVMRTARLTKRLLAFSKGGEPAPEPASIETILRDAVEFFLSGSNVKYALDIHEPLWTVKVDRGQVEQVFQNLIINADQAMPEGGFLTIAAKNISADGNAGRELAAGEYVCVSIEDTGCGIAPEDAQKILAPYFTTKEKGTGLGLPAAYAIVNKAKGLLRFSSVHGKGSVFKVYLPAASKAPGEPKDDRGESVVCGSGNILVMDDEPSVRAAFDRILAMAGYQAHCVENGEQAIDAYVKAMRLSRPFDAVILDLTIRGGKNGRETIELLREIDPGVRAIVASGYSNDPILAHYRDYGFNGVIAKPFTLKEAAEKVREVLSGAGSEKPEVKRSEPGS